jgi:hypothetical protein
MPEFCSILQTIYIFILKIFQMAIKYINIFQSKAFQNLPKFDFWFEN